MSIVETILRGTSSVNKNTLIELLRKNGTEDLDALEDNVSIESLIFILKQKKFDISEGFFVELADLLAIPYIEDYSIADKITFVSALPYSFLKDNLIVPLEIDNTTAKFATANPFNRVGLTILKEIIEKKWDLKIYVASLEAIEKAIEHVYSELHKDSALWDLYYRSPDESAYKVLVPWQKRFIMFLAGMFLMFSMISYPVSLTLFFTLINILYFVMNPFKWYIASKGLRNRHRTTYVSDSDVGKLKDEALPTYTILVPLYKESKVLSQIMENIYKIDYPKEKLDVKILFEENDEETLVEARKLGLFGHPQVRLAHIAPKLYRNFLKIFDPIIVPKGQVTTKPRACNYGLIRAKGDYVTIYDAEDDPEPDQLKKAIISFERMGQSCVCLQSHLNFYNSGENLLTKWFSLEYLYWFDYYLEGLDAIDAPLPLGGTSNHFKTKRLQSLGSWDPYNVTEDADLGIRIYRSGLKTGMLNSYTYEEANKNVWNWIRQRSRWCKGHMQTFLVHMRHPLKMIQNVGWKKCVLFQLTFGGNILLPLINPLLWMITILTLLFPGTFNFLSSVSWIAFISTFNLIVGNLIHISLYLRTVIVEKRFSLIPIALSMPFYWVLGSIGAWKGIIQLITKPHYWEKTIHGISNINNLVTIK
jgi:cellulose synthase/poly-beta-1,6-N-acetylglucosamine synthase-like glycosyltransferase